MRRSSAVALVAAVAVALGVVAAADAYGPLDTGLLPDARVSPATTPSPAAPPWTTPLPRPARSVLRAVTPGAKTQAAQPTTRGLARVLGPLVGTDPLGDRFGGVVLDPAAGRVYWARGAREPLTPASTAKLLTAAAALESMGPGHRRHTRLVAGGPRTVVLVGGGDATLQTRTTPQNPKSPTDSAPPATLSGLATRAARALRADGDVRVRLRYDASLFVGPAVEPLWPDGYVPSGVVSPVTALSADQGRVRPDTSEREADPSLAAARRFAALLARRGVRVVGAPRPGRARRGATQVAAVASPPLADVVERMLSRSDNDLAEAVFRLVAISEGLPGSFDGGRIAVARVLDRLGVPTSDVTTYDGSGLSREDRVPALVLAQVLAVAVDPNRPALGPVISGLPVAGFSGTLADRFDREAAAGGLGLVRAKTGTLTGVTGMAGTVLDVDGRLLVYAFLADRVPPVRTLDARAALDRLAAAVASCGCR